MARKINLIILIFTLLQFLSPVRGSCNPPVSKKNKDITGFDIVLHSFNVYQGSDQISELTFILEDKEDKRLKIILERFWKQGDENDGIEQKLLYFYKYPPSERGISGLIWTYLPEFIKDDKKMDKWIYTPRSGRIKKLSENEREEFKGSDLTYFELEPRQPGIDEHTFIKEVSIKGRSYYIVETKLKTDNKKYSRIKRWIDKERFLTARTDYYGIKDTVVKRKFIRWRKIKDAWLWDSIMAVNLQTGHKTNLIIKNIEIDSNLPDDIFHERYLTRGPEFIHSILKR